MKKDVIIYGTNIAGLRAAYNFGKIGYSVLLLNTGDYIGAVKNKLLAFEERNICNNCLRLAMKGISNIEIWHNADITGIKYLDSKIKVEVKHKPPEIDERKCIECGKCIGKGVKYIPRPLGGIYLLDKKNCPDCDELKSICPVGAINPYIEEKTEGVEADVLIVGSEYVPNEEEIAAYGYGKIDGVLSTGEVEHLFSGIGENPDALLKHNGEPVNRVAYVATPSLESKSFYNYFEFTSAINTALAIKGAKPNAKIDIYFSLPNFYGKGNIAYMDFARSKGINFIYNRKNKVSEGPEVNGKSYDWVVLSSAGKPPEKNEKLAKILGINLEDGYFRTGKRKLETEKERIFAVGEAHSPKSNTDSLFDGSAIVVEALEYLPPLPKMAPQRFEFRDVSEEEPKIGIFLCRCGAEYNLNVKTEEIANRLNNLADYVDVIDYLCLPEGREKIKERIKKNRINRVLIAACSPFLRGNSFSVTLAEAGLNPSLMEIVQLKEFGNGFEKSISIIEAGIEKLRDRKEYPLPVDNFNNRTIVIGSSIGAMSGAISLARSGFPVVILNEGNISPHTELGEKLLSNLKSMRSVEIIENVNIDKLEGYAGNFIVHIHSNEGRKYINAGAILFGPSGKVEYNEKDAEPYSKIGLICGDIVAGYSSDSRYTCPKAMELARNLHKEGKRVSIAFPVTPIKGKEREEWIDLINEGVEVSFFNPIEWDLETAKKALINNGAEVVFIISRDYRAGTALAERLGLDTNPDGTVKYLDDPYDDINIRLRPHALATNGIFIVGPLHKPMTEEEEIIDGENAAYSALALVKSEKISPAAGRMVSYTNYKKCAGCGLCVDACQYGARVIDVDEKVAKVKEILCEGCAACVSACPSGAAEVRLYEQKSMLRAIQSILK